MLLIIACCIGLILQYDSYVNCLQIQLLLGIWHNLLDNISYKSRCRSGRCVARCCLLVFHENPKILATIYHEFFCTFWHFLLSLNKFAASLLPAPRTAQSPTPLCSLHTQLPSYRQSLGFCWSLLGVSVLYQHIADIISFPASYFPTPFGALIFSNSERYVHTNTQTYKTYATESYKISGIILTTDVLITWLGVGRCHLAFGGVLGLHL